MAKPKKAARRPKKITRGKKRPRRSGTDVIYPGGVETKLGVSDTTRWRMEREGRLPARDFFIGGVAVGWRPETLEAAARGQVAAA